MRKELGVFLFVLGIFLLNWPFLKIFEHALPLYIFSAWFLFILIMMLSEIRSRRN